MRDVIVVGSGVIGATVAKTLREQAGKNVLLLDSGQPHAGSRASEGHLKPSWFGMKPDQYEPAMALLGETWGLIKETYEVRPEGKETTVYRVDMDVVTRYPYTRALVTSLGHLTNYPVVRYVEGGYAREERCRLLVVAAGCWVPDLLPRFKVKAKQGVSFRLQYNLDRPFIETWAPYKQIVAHQQGPNDVWVGDGTAVLPTNWTADRTRRCYERCVRAVGFEPDVGGRTLTGLRPYCPPLAEGEPCLFQQLGPRAWVATGAGKSGTIAAGWVARRLLDAISS